MMRKTHWGTVGPKIHGFYWLVISGEIPQILGAIVPLLCLCLWVFVGWRPLTLEAWQAASLWFSSLVVPPGLLLLNKVVGGAPSSLKKKKKKQAHTNDNETYKLHLTCFLHGQKFHKKLGCCDGKRIHTRLVRKFKWPNPILSTNLVRKCKDYEVTRDWYLCAYANHFICTQLVCQKKLD